MLKVDVFTTNDIEMAKGSVLVVKWFFFEWMVRCEQKNVLVGLLSFSLLCCLHYLFIYLYLYSSSFGLVCYILGLCVG